MIRGYMVGEIHGEEFRKKLNKFQDEVNEFLFEHRDKIGGIHVDKIGGNFVLGYAILGESFKKENKSKDVKQDGKNINK